MGSTLGRGDQRWHKDRVLTVADSQTARLLGQGRRLEHFTIGWNVLEAGVSVWAGIVAGSTALIGFGLDSAHIAATETPFPEKI